MSVDIIDDPKNTGDVAPFTVEFEDYLEVGDSITGATVKVYETSTQTETTDDMLVAASTQTVGSVVSCLIEGGTHGVKYSAEFIAQTSYGETKVHVLKFKCKDEKR